MNIADALAWAKKRLTSSPSPELDAEVLLSSALQKDKAYLLAHPETRVKLNQVRTFKKMVARRQSGTPVAYNVGRKDFYGLEFEVNKHTLIPRPATETLVERAIAIGGKKVVDIGTGSGCIAIAIAKHLPDAKVYATDISKKALVVALRNAQRHGTLVSLVRGNLLDPLAGEQFDVITANLPYLREDQMPERGGDASIGAEPREALLGGGSDGLDLYRELFVQLPAYLAPGGTALVEIDDSQASEITKTAQLVLDGSKVKILQDLQGLDRVAEVTLPE